MSKRYPTRRFPTPKIPYNQRYCSTSICLTTEEKRKYETLSVDNNNLLLDFLIPRVAKETKRERMLHTLPLRFDIKLEPKLRKLQSLLKEKNLVFSDIYKKHYRDFIKYVLDNDRPKLS